MERTIPGWVWAVLVFLAFQAVRERLDRAPGERALARARELRVENDPRRMSARELRQLPGVGETLAQLVARTRDAHRGVTALAWEDVPGIGEVRAREIRAWCRTRGFAADPLAPGASEHGGGYPDEMGSLLRIVTGRATGLLAG